MWVKFNRKIFTEKFLQEFSIRNAIDEEIQTSHEEKEDNEDENDSKSVIVALSGFGLSVVFIWWAMIILVRFYIFDGILYSLFIFCMLVTGTNFLRTFYYFSPGTEPDSYFSTGIIFNVTSVNILIIDFRQPINFLPFIIGSPLTIFWTVFCIILPIFQADSFSKFAYLPIATYDSVFYDGLGYDPEVATVHPFTKKFMKQSSFFSNTELILLLLVALAGEPSIIQIIDLLIY